MAKIGAPTNAQQPALPMMQAPYAPPAPQAPEQPTFTPNVPYQDSTTGVWMMNGVPLQMPGAPPQPVQAQPQPVAPVAPPLNGLPPLPSQLPPAFPTAFPAFGNGAPPPAPAPLQGGVMDQMQQAMGHGAALGGGGALLKATNFGAVQDLNLMLLPLKDDAGNPQQYEGKVIKAEMAKTNGGDDCIGIEIIVTWPKVGVGVKLWDNLMFTEKTLWKTKSMSRACDCLSEDGQTFIGNSEKDFVDNIVRFGIRHDEYPEASGQFRNKIATGYSAGKDTPGLAGVAPVQQVAQPAPVQIPVYQVPATVSSQPTQPGLPNFGPQ